MARATPPLTNGGPALRPQSATRRLARSFPADIERLCAALEPQSLGGVPLLLVVDDSDFAARHVNNWVWVAFTRSNPTSDIHGVGAGVRHKHWGCRGPLVIDARVKPGHSPPLVEDAAVSRRVEEMAARGGPPAGLF
jgi:4-hydroxy-3-polyprenylbenzoate decarboxylase